MAITVRKKIEGTLRGDNVVKPKHKTVWRAWRQDGSFKDYSHAVDYHRALQHGYLPRPPGEKAPEPEPEKPVGEAVVDTDFVEENSEPEKTEKPEKGKKIERK